MHSQFVDAILRWQTRIRLRASQGALPAISLIAFTTVLHATNASADIVTVSDKSGKKTSRVVGQVLDFTGERLTIRLANGREQTIASNAVVKVDTAKVEAHGAADDHFNEGRYAEALADYRQALRDESRAWMQREILSQCVWCYRYLGNTSSAFQAFLALYGNDSSTQYFSAIPLSWVTAQPDPEIERLAIKLLADKSNPASRLIAGSWLLATSKRSDAIETLRQLASVSDARIVYLAEAQLWRTRSATADRSELARWEARIQGMPTEIRAGPYFIVGQTQARHNDHANAALSFLRVPISYPRHRALAARGLLAAARQLEKIDQTAEARQLYREVIVDFRESDVAAEARRRFDALPH